VTTGGPCLRPGPFATDRTQIRLEETGVLTVNGVAWAQARHIRFVVPLVATIRPSRECDIALEGVLFSRDGVQEDFEADIRSLLVGLRDSAVRRLFLHLKAAGKEVRLPKISRAGGGAEEMVMLDDLVVFRCLAHLALIAPGAVGFQKAFHRFRVPNPLLLWYIRDQIIAPVLVARSRQALVPRPGPSVPGSRTAPDSVVAFGAGTDARLAASSIATRSWLGSGSMVTDRRHRAYRPGQQEAVDYLNQRHRDGFQTSALFVSTGGGKTLMTFAHLLHLARHNTLPRYILLSFPKKSLANAVTEAQQFFQRVDVYQPTHKPGPVPTGCTSVRSVAAIRPYTITLVEHDALRKIAVDLLPLLPDAVLVLDEIHKMLAPTTQRTNFAQLMASSAKHVVLLSATPTKSEKLGELIAWLTTMTNFVVTHANIFVAIAAAFSATIDTGITARHLDVPVEIHKDDPYWLVVPVSQGGTSPDGTTRLVTLLQRVYAVVLPAMVNEIIARVATGVFVVVDNRAQLEWMYTELVRRRPCDPTLIRTLTGSESLVLTPDTVAAGAPDLKIVISTRHGVEGFSLSTLHSMVTSVYLSNAASRKQVLGRINRIGGRYPSIDVVTVIAGLLYLLRERQLRGDSYLASMGDLGLLI
jgi:hypothetical protein